MSEQATLPDGWVREELWAGMGTIGQPEFKGMGGGFKCDNCSHYIPIDALEEPTCPACDAGGLIGTVIMGRQEVTAIYPEGWFDDAE